MDLLTRTPRASGQINIHASPSHIMQVPGSSEKPSNFLSYVRSCWAIHGLSKVAHGPPPLAPGSITQAQSLRNFLRHGGHAGRKGSPWIAHRYILGKGLQETERYPQRAGLRIRAPRYSGGLKSTLLFSSLLDRQPQVLHPRNRRDYRGLGQHCRCCFTLWRAWEAYEIQTA